MAHAPLQYRESRLRSSTMRRDNYGLLAWLARKKSEGKRLGRPKGKLPATIKLVAEAKLSISTLVP